MLTTRKILALTAIGVLAAYIGLLYSSLHSDDQITRANAETEWELLRYSLLGNPGRTQEWLLRFHGEAPGSAVMFTFVDWTLAHPAKAGELLETLPKEKQRDLASSVAWAALDSGDSGQMSETFVNTKSPFFIDVLREIKNLENAKASNQSVHQKSR